jgi:multidrug efflux pump subunit AcrA (membrane-fusion protein)
MKIRAVVGFLLVALVVIVGLFYVQASLRRASAPPQPGLTPSLDDAPARVYGRVEPLGREVFVAPRQSRRVARVLVQEGRTVAAGQPLCELDADVERQALQLALSREREFEAQLDLVLDELKRKEPLTASGPVANQQALRVAVLRVRESEARLDLALDELKRAETLFRDGTVTEQDYIQKSLEAELLRRQIATARAEAEIEFGQKTLEAELLRKQIATAQAEVELKRRELDTLVLRSPIEGFLYTFDVRLGEQLNPQDYQRIVLGKPEKQVRLFLESFWIDKVRAGETLREVGLGKVVSVSDYVGARDFRTDDSLERLDTKYAQAILQLEGATPVPLGKVVLCERQRVGTKDRNP